MSKSGTDGLARAVAAQLATGWNTWHSPNVLAHVLLPAGVALEVGVKEYRSGLFLREALIGMKGESDPAVRPLPRAYDGRYTGLRVSWQGLEFDVETGLDGEEFVALVTPRKSQRRPPVLVVRASVLWNKPSTVALEKGALLARWSSGAIALFPVGQTVEERQIPVAGPYLALALDAPAGVSQGRFRSAAEVRAVLDRARARVESESGRFGGEAESHAALRTCLAWDTIYDPAGDRVISPVSRLWNNYNGGWVLFCWDTFFAAYLAAVDSPALAAANAIEILRERAPDGFVPNTSNGHGFKTLDRSQPPVGSMMIREIYRLTGNRGLVEEAFEPLLVWNRWWLRARLSGNLLTWGSNPYTPRLDNEWETKGVGETYGCALESGLDNSPMYDGVPVDPERGLLRLHDVGLNSLYVRDCEDLADLARVLGRTAEERELRERAEGFRQALKTLWSEERGLFLNRRLDTGVFSERRSPTLFYPLLADAATPEQARRMVEEHLLNPSEFWGDWVLPSISRDDPAYPDQHYWRGRIWPPMNFLVYLGLRRYGLGQARAELARKSAELLLQEWRAHGHVHENYCGNTGWGCPYEWSDRFYHWGGLLGAIALIEAGHLPGPEKPLP